MFENPSMLNFTKYIIVYIKYFPFFKAQLHEQCPTYTKNYIQRFFSLNFYKWLSLNILINCKKLKQSGKMENWSMIYEVYS